MWKFDGTCNLHATKDRYSKKKIKVFLPNFTFTAFYSSIFAKVTVGKNCNRLDTSQGPDISS